MLSKDRPSATTTPKKLTARISALESELQLQKDLVEVVNSKIISIKGQSSGLRNRDNFKTVVYFYCGELKLDPLESA